MEEIQLCNACLKRNVLFHNRNRGTFYFTFLVEKLDGENLSLVYPQDKHAYWLGQISIITPQINYRPYNEMAVRSFSKDCRSGEACNCTKFLSTETRAPTCAERGNIRENRIENLP